MCVFKNGAFYHYEFTLDGRRHRGSTGTADRDEAVREESRQRERLEKSYGQVIEEEARQQRRKTIQEAADEFLVEYTAKHESSTFAVYALGHVTDHMGKKLVVEITPTVVKGYQTARLAEQAGPKSINNEVLLLLRLCGDQGELIRSRLKRAKALKLKVGPSPGKPFSVEEQDRLLDRARQSTEAARLACERQARGEKPSKGQKQGGSPSIYPALVLALNCGMRDSEIKNLRWSQIDWEKRILTVGKSKTEAGAGRTIPLNGAVLTALMDHTRWYARQFGEAKADWFVFPGGGRSPKDPSVSITSLKTSWKKVRERAGVTGRWHDSRHTLVTELAESGAGDETIMAIAGHVSRQMLSRYAHIRTEAKRGALEDVDRKRTAARAQSLENRQRQAAAEAQAAAQIQ